LRPELEDEPNEDGPAETTETEASQELDNDEPLQE
jgi:hypothetical protein